MTKIQEMWDTGNHRLREYLLKMYFRSDATIKRHIDKAWNRLPSGFKNHINIISRSRWIEMVKEASSNP